MPRERLIKSVSATSDSQGRATFTLGPAEQGYVWEGSVQIPNCPAGALFTATVLSTNWGQWAGPTNFGPVQLYGGETLTVTAVGLNPSTNYVLTIFGVWMAEEEARPIPPAAPQSVVAVETATVLVNGVSPAGSPNKITGVRPPTLTRRLTIVPSGGAAGEIYQVIGDTTGAVYGTFQPGVHVPQYVAIEPAIDPTYTLQYLSGSAASCTLWVLASFTNPLVESNNLFPIRAIPWFGPYNSTFGPNIFAVTANQTCIAAQGGGQSIILQQVTAVAVAMNGPTQFRFHDGSGNSAIGDIILPSTGSDQLIFPDGFELPANSALLCDTTISTTGTLLSVRGTFAVSPTV